MTFRAAGLAVLLALGCGGRDGIGVSDGVDVAPICGSSVGQATVGLRLKAFVESFGPAGSFASVCEEDYGPTLRRLGQTLAARFRG
jgi:hypothetical protein